MTSNPRSRPGPVAVNAAENDVFCVLPWSHLCASVDGVWGRCCVDASLYHDGYYEATERPEFVLHPDALGCVSQSRYAADNPGRVMGLAEAFNSDNLRQTRLAMLAGQPVEACSYCYEREAAGGESYRQKAPAMLAECLDIDAIVATTRPDGAVPGGPVYLDLRFGNTCNLKCIMCGFPVSSRWGLDEHPRWAPAHIDPYRYDEALWSALRQHAGALRRVYFAGGEPFLQAGHFRLVDLLIEVGAARHISLSYNSNLTILPMPLLRQFALFHRVGVGASCDGTGSVFERIRAGARWSDFVRNLRVVKQHADVWLAVSPQRDNVLHLGDIIEFAEAEGVSVDLTNFVHYPRTLSVRNLPQDVKLRARAYLDDLTARRRSSAQHDLARQLDMLRAFLLADADR